VAQLSIVKVFPKGILAPASLDEASLLGTYKSLDVVPHTVETDGDSDPISIFQECQDAAQKQSSDTVTQMQKEIAVLNATLATQSNQLTEMSADFHAPMAKLDNIASAPAASAEQTVQKSKKKAQSPSGSGASHAAQLMAEMNKYANLWDEGSEAGKAVEDDDSDAAVPTVVTGSWPPYRPLRPRLLQT